MIYEKRGKWYVEVDGTKRNFDTEADAKAFMGVPAPKVSAWQKAKDDLVPEMCSDCDSDPCECEDEE